YRASPGCLSTSPSTGATPCTDEPVTVADKWSFRPAKSDTEYYLTLNNPDINKKLKVAYGFWSEVNVGDTLTAKVWRGRVTLLTTKSLQTHTDESPYSDPQRDAFFAVLGAVILAIGITSWVQNNRQAAEST